MNNLQILGKQNFMGKEIPVIEGGFGEGKRCLTDKTIAEIHNQPTREIRRRINDNIKRFKEYIDFIDLKGVGESHTLASLGYAKQSITQAEHIYLLSERGYAKLIKIMDTDLAWEIHDKLIDEYFTMRKVINSLEQQKANLLLDIYNGGQNGVLASKKLTEIEVGEATRPLITIIDTAINDNGLFDIGVIGKMLKPYCKEMGTNKIFEFLRENKILKNKPGTQKHNNPYDRYCNYFEMKNTYYYIGCERNTHIKTYFNGKGLKWFLKKLAREGYIKGSQIEDIGSRIKNMGEEVI